MYADLARAVWVEADRGRAAADVARLRERHPRASRDELARRLIRRTALQCGAAGFAWTAPAAYFGGMPLGPELAYQVVAMNRLVLSLAALYRSSGAVKDRAVGAGVGISAGVAADLLRRALVTLLRRSLPRRPGTRGIVGGLAGGALAYGTALGVGNLARDVFAGRKTFGLGRLTG